MSRNSRKKENGSVRVELKYCEHCGGLWVREGGGSVYCEKCEPKIAALPVPKRSKRPGRIVLPVGNRSVLDERDFPIPDDAGDLEAAGGAA